MLREDLLIPEDATVKAALKQLDKSAEKMLAVVDAGRRLLGTLTDGDIRRHILRGNDLDAGIEGVYHKGGTSMRREDFSLSEARKILVKGKFGVIPIVDAERRVVDQITWDQAFSQAGLEQARPGREAIDVPVVIMAGGKGSRLEPYTKVFPKPLIPVGDKPIMEIIIDQFRQHGVRDFYATLNFKGEMIETYFNGIERDYRLHYLREKDFLGTAGSLTLVADRIDRTFIVSNCDIIVKADYAEVVRFHRKHGAALTVLSSIQHFVIPYGVVSFREGGEVTDIAEKPEYTLTINTGVYVLDRGCLDLIPKGRIFNMTDLILALVAAGKKVVTYPVNENDYVDIGQWDDYKKAVEKLTVK
ncbi:MAG: nucleotidyltransferase family protein [Elusimicrobia bacterium]|nr:nucleotidyltransferase family protein [Elusimicrobiota bacterium]